jgi:DNA-binding transcriptional regulator YhcF (GntR family)
VTIYKIVIMTNWLPDLSAGSGPVYLRLADNIESAIASGALPAGSKLPPQRNLAYDIGVTIGTIGRAYALVHERGLVAGEVGRGTYVLDRAETAPGNQPDPLTIALGGTRTIDAPARASFRKTGMRQGAAGWPATTGRPKPRTSCRRSVHTRLPSR